MSKTFRGFSTAGEFSAIATPRCEQFRSYQLTGVGKYDNIKTGAPMTRPTRPVSWIKPALKDFEAFPEGARLICLNALTIAAEGGKADIAKPLPGLGKGTFEIAFTYQGEAYRVVYNVAVGADVWVLHAFHKKSTHGIKTPQRDIDVIKKRLRTLKEVSR